MYIFILSFIFFLIDFIVKIQAQKYLTFNEPITIIPNFLWLRLIYNKGAAFGILQGKVILLVVIALVFLGVLFWWVRNNVLTKCEQVFVSMIVGGALSNFWDRIFLGHVVDYIDLGWWPIFNIADSLICVGCVAFFVMEFVKPKKKEPSSSVLLPEGEGREEG